MSDQDAPDRRPPSERRLSLSRRLYDGRLDDPKSRHGVRRVPLSAPLAQRLWRRLATESDDALVFSNGDGQPLDPGNLYRVVRKAGERAGIAWPVGVHALRHTCGTIMFRRGVPKEQIRKLLGHRSWEFTAGTYVHLNDDDLPDGDVLADLLIDQEMQNEDKDEEAREPRRRVTDSHNI